MKTKLVSLLKNKLFLACILSLLLSAFAFADDCKVPVCDIDGTIQVLSKGTVDARSNYLGDLYNKVRSSSNVDVLHNIHDFAKKSSDLQKNLHDPDNVLAWSVFLREYSITGLLKNAPFVLEEMKGLYQETFEIPDLSIDRQIQIRFNNYQRWKAQINTIMDTKIIYSLYSYISFAQGLSDTNKDEDYVLREAVGVLDLLGKRLSYLYPNYEGIFEVKTYCTPAPKACAVPDLAVNRVVLMNSLTDLGIFSALYNVEQSLQSYLFYRSVIESFGTRIYSVTEALATTGRPSEVYFQLADNQNFKGYVVSSRYSGSLHFEGNVVYSPVKFYVDEGIADQKPKITGKFQGVFGDKKATMIIRQKKNKALMATMLTGEDTTGLLLDFTNGEYVEHRGLINLVGFPTGKVEPYKINMAYRKDANGKYRWVGGYFSLSGKFEKIEFTRAAEIDQPDTNDLNADTIIQFLN